MPDFSRVFELCDTLLDHCSFIIFFFTEAVAYEFGPGRGLITYTFPTDRRPEMKRDTIAMGFVTGTNDAVLLRIESATSNDYLEIEIVSELCIALPAGVT